MGNFRLTSLVLYKLRQKNISVSGYYLVGCVYKPTPLKFSLAVVSMLGFLSAAFFLGLKHSFDHDHILTVSNFLTKSASLKKSIQLASNWVVGHLVGTITVTLILLIFRETIVSFVFDKMDLLVGATLIFFGILGICKDLTMHSHSHFHGQVAHEHYHFHSNPSNHEHKHILGIGIVQGLANNDELIVLLTLSLGLASLAEMVLAVVTFSFGVFAGMVIFSLLFSIFSMNMGNLNLTKNFNLIVDSATVLYGVYMLIF